MGQTSHVISMAVGHDDEVEPREVDTLGLDVGRENLRIVAWPSSDSPRPECPGAAARPLLRFGLGGCGGRGSVTSMSALQRTCHSPVFAQSTAYPSRHLGTGRYWCAGPIAAPFRRAHVYQDERFATAGVIAQRLRASPSRVQNRIGIATGSGSLIFDIPDIVLIDPSLHVRGGNGFSNPLRTIRANFALPKQHIPAVVW